MKAESEKRGVGSSIEIKLCRLEKSAEGSKAYAINKDDNGDEITFLRAVTTRSRRTIKVNFETRKSQIKPFEYYISVSISHHQFTFTYISLYVYLTSVTSMYLLCVRHKKQKIDSIIKRNSSLTLQTAAF